MSLAEKYISMFFDGGIFSDLMVLQFEQVNTEFTRTERLIIYVLNQQGPKNMGQLTSIFKIPHSTTNFLVKKLAEAGVVTTRKSDADKRVIEVNLTEKGKEKATEILQNVDMRLTRLLEAIETFLQDKMEPAELEVVQKAIQLLVG